MAPPKKAVFPSKWHLVMLTSGLAQALPKHELILRPAPAPFLPLLSFWVNLTSKKETETPRLFLLGPLPSMTTADLFKHPENVKSSILIP